MRRIVQLATARPRLVLVIWLVVVATSAALASQLDGALSGGGFTNPRAEALVTQAAVQKAFGDAPNQFVVVLDGDRQLGPSDYRKAEQALQKAGAVQVATPETTHGLVAENRETAVLTAGFAGSSTSAQNLVPGLQSELRHAGLAQHVYVTGQPALDYQLNAHSKEDATRAEMIAFPLLIVVLLVVFGSVVSALLPLLIAGSALGIASGVGYVATRFTDVSNLYSNIVSMIGLAVAVDYSLFIIKRFREEMSAGSSPREAVVTAMSTAGKSVVYSAVAVALALAALFIPRVMAFTSIALGGIVVTIAALAVTIFVLPAGLVLLGNNIDKLRLPRPRPRRTSKRPAARPATRHPGIVGVAGILVMLAAAVPIVGLSLQSPVASATVLPKGDPARTGLDIIGTRIGQENLFPVDVVLTVTGDVPAAVTATARAATYLQRLPEVSKVTSVVASDTSHATLEHVLSTSAGAAAAKQLWHRVGNTTTTRLLVTTKDSPDSVRVHDLVRTIRTDLPNTLEAHVSVAVTGATAQGLDFDQTLIRSIPLVAAVVLALTFLMLARAFRSAILPALALLFNVLVVGASLGLLTAIQRASSDEPLNSVTPILLFAVMFGLSMDYMVIIISRMREAFQNGAAYDDAVREGARRTRGMINSAAIIMVAVFVSFLSAQISIVREIGIGLAIAVILDAVIIRMVVMPNILRAIGPRAFGRLTVTGRAPVPATAPAELVDA
jgi:RND superfamily putative drug exporter